MDRHVRLTTLVLSAAVVALTARTAGAQMVATSFEELRPLVKPGQTVYVTDASGHTRKGRLGQLSPSSLQLLMEDPDGRNISRPKAFSESDVVQVRVRKFDSLWNGTLIGLAVVGTPWAIGCLQGCTYGEPGAEHFIHYLALITSGIGAGVGALVDAGINERAVVYYHAPNPRASSTGIEPFLTTSGAGVRLSVRF